MTTDSWKVDADGDWSDAADWSLGKVPTSSDAVVISTVDVHTITHSTGSDAVQSLTVGANDHFVFSGGSLEILTKASFADGFTQTGGVLNGGAIAITGPGVLIGGSSEGSTSFAITGTISLANYLLGGASVVTNRAKTNQTGQITLGDVTGVGATISNASGATYDVAGDFGIGQGASSASFVNAGLLEKGAGSGNSIIGVDMSSTGTLTALSGNLMLAGPVNSVGGTLSGAGQISFGGGVTTLTSTSITAGALGLYNAATLNLGGSLSFAGVFTDQSLDGNTTLNLGAHNLTLSGASSLIQGNFGTAVVTGSGVLSNTGTLSLDAVLFGGTVTLANSKVIDQTGAVTMGDGSGKVTAIMNAAAGAYDFTTDVSLGESGATIAFTNQGTLEKTGGNGVSDVSLAVTSTGTIGAARGLLEFDNSLVNAGTISGAGSVGVVGSGAASLNAGTVLSVARLDLFNLATLNLGASLSYAGVFDDSSLDGNTTIGLGGHALTLSGASNTVLGVFGSAVILGPGILDNAGTLTLGNAVVDGTAELENTKTINQNANVAIGGGGGQTATIVNATAGFYDVAGAFTIANGASAASHFDNSGRFEVTAGAGVAVIATTFNNLAGGLVNVVSGALQNSGVLVSAGAVDGTRLILAGGSQTTLGVGATLGVKEVDLFSVAGLTLETNVAYSGSFIDAALDGNTTVNLGGHNLSLNGSSEFDANFGTDVVTGGGLMKLGGAALLEGGGLLVGGTAKLEIASTLTATGVLQIGDGSANAASTVIDKGAAYDLTADVGLQKGASAASMVTNNGLFEKTAGTGTSVVGVAFVNAGTITVTSGTLEFLVGDLTNKGTINGVVTKDGSGDILITPVKGATSLPGSRQFAQASAAFGAIAAGAWMAAGPHDASVSTALLAPAAGSRHADWQ